MKQWIMTDARWYQFWMPQSSWIGGLIAAVVIETLLALGAVVVEIL